MTKPPRYEHPAHLLFRVCKRIFSDMSPTHEYRREETARNMIEIFVDQETCTVDQIKEYINDYAAPWGKCEESDYSETEWKEILEELEDTECGRGSPKGPQIFQNSSGMIYRLEDSEWEINNALPKAILDLGDKVMS